MKGKKLIVIMAIVILIFTIQASCALDEDNDFNLTKTNDIDTVNVQIDKVNNDISDNILVNDSQASASSAKEILGATNNDVLGVDCHFTGTTYADLKYFLMNTVSNGDNVFLDGKTFSGSQTSTLIIKKNVNIYGGSTIDDPTPAIFDLSQFGTNTVFQTDSSTCTDFSINNIVFKNFNRASTYMITAGMSSAYMQRSVINNCTFMNNTVSDTGSIIRYITYGPDIVLSNCNFYNNKGSLIVDVSTRNSNKDRALSFEAYNNTFINNTGTHVEDKQRSLGLCFKVYERLNHQNLIIIHLLITLMHCTEQHTVC